MEHTQLEREEGFFQALGALSGKGGMAFRQHVRFTDCKIIWEGRDDSYKYVYQEVSLNDLDQDEISIGGEGSISSDDKSIISVKCSRINPKCVAWKHEDSNQYGGLYMKDKFVFHASEVSRVVTALVDAINSCGGKKRRY